MKHDGPAFAGRSSSVILYVRSSVRARTIRWVNPARVVGAISARTEEKPPPSVLISPSNSIAEFSNTGPPRRPSAHDVVVHDEPAEVLGVEREVGQPDAVRLRLAIRAQGSAESQGREALGPWDQCPRSLSDVVVVAGAGTGHGGGRRTGFWPSVVWRDTRCRGRWVRRDGFRCVNAWLNGCDRWALAQMAHLSSE